MQIIDDAKKDHSVKALCAALDVKRNTYYARLKSQACLDMQREALKHQTRVIHEQVDACYGTRRMSAELRSRGFDVGRFQARSLMRECAIEANMPKPPANPKIGGKQDVASPNILKRQFDVEQPDTHYAGDISYIYTATGWTYLAVVMDLYNRQIVGWAYSRTPDAQLAIRALRLAVESRKPEHGLLFHSDQGCQYTAKAFRDYLKTEKVVQSMSRRGNCWDNAVVERFFRSLRTERIRKRVYPSHKAAMADISQYIAEFYNRVRLHSTLNYTSPVAKQSSEKKAA